MDLTKNKLGPFNLYTIETGRFKLDGGAMFGVVPKTLWSRQIPADENNRIPMAMRCLLIESEKTGRVYLVDNGAGTKFDEKFQKIYQLDYEHSSLERSLDYHGFSPEDITDLVFTHLHFDHCGGTTYFDEQGKLAHTFPNATYYVTRTHWETAIHPNAREKASFLKENIGPLSETDRLQLIEEGYEYEEGFDHVIVNGHTVGQQLPRLSAEGKTLVFAADLLPTHVHVPLPWVMGYDMRPIDTLDEKDRILKLAADNDWAFYLEHDAEYEMVRVDAQNGRLKMRESFRLDEF